MKTYVRIFMISRWLLRVRNASDKHCRENQNTHFMLNNSPPLPRKSCRVWDNVEKYGRARQVTDGSIIHRMRFACWVIKAQTHTQNTSCILLFHANSGYANASHCYVIVHCLSYFTVTCVRCHRINLEFQITVIHRLSSPYLPLSEQLPW
jgi:hypothetical protein